MLRWKYFMRSMDWSQNLVQNFWQHLGLKHGSISGFLSLRHRNRNPDPHRALHTLSLPALVQITAKSHHLAGFYGLMKCSVLRQARVWHLGTVEPWSQFWHSLSVALGKSRPLPRREFIKCPMALLKWQRAVKQCSAPTGGEALEGLSAVLSQLPATAPEVLVLRQSWGGLLWVTERGLQASDLVSRPMLPLTRVIVILKSLGAKYRHIFSPSSLVLQLCDTSYCQALQVVWAGLANPLSGAHHFSLVCLWLPLISEIFFSLYRFLITMYSHFAINHRYFSIYH